MTDKIPPPRTVNFEATETFLKKKLKIIKIFIRLACLT